LGEWQRAGPVYLTEPSGLLRSIVSHDNYADYRVRKLGDLEEKQLRAQTKLIMSKPVADLYYYYWRNKDRKDEMDAVEYGKFRAASQFVSKVWGRLDDPDSFYNKAAYAITDGSKQNRETVKRDLDAAAMPWLAIFQDPDAAKFTTVLHFGAGDTAKVELSAKEHMVWDKKRNAVMDELNEKVRSNAKWMTLTQEEQRDVKLDINQYAREAATEYLFRNRPK
jgi:hypothetical protein